MLAKIYQNALNLLTRRDHSRLELVQKLSRKNYDRADIDTTLQRLEAEGWINESRFTENYANYRRRRGFGPRRIAMELGSKGIQETMIAEHLQMADNAWLIEIRTIWQKQFKGRKPCDAQTRAKQMRFLFNRGFTQDQIASIFKNTENIE